MQSFPPYSSGKRNLFALLPPMAGLKSHQSDLDHMLHSAGRIVGMMTGLSQTQVIRESTYT